MTPAAPTFQGSKMEMDGMGWMGCIWIYMVEVYMDVSENSDTPKSSILIGFSIINHPFWGTPIFGNTHIYIYIYTYIYVDVYVWMYLSVSLDVPNILGYPRQCRNFMDLPYTYLHTFVCLFVWNMARWWERMGNMSSKVYPMALDMSNTQNPLTMIHLFLCSTNT